MTGRITRTRGPRVRAAELADLPALDAAAAECRSCRLCTDRRRVVTASGRRDAEVVVVAEAPGYHDERTGELLSSPGARELFELVLEDAGLTRDAVYLTSVVKCRPPTGRTPFPDEVEACEGWLFRELALVQPRVVVTLGALALRLVTGRQERLADVHGAMLHAQLLGRDIVVWPMLHPAAAVHVPNLVDGIRADARALARLLRGAHAVGDAAATAPVDGVAAPDRTAADGTAAGSEPQLSMEF